MPVWFPLLAMGTMKPRLPTNFTWEQTSKWVQCIHLVHWAQFTKRMLPLFLKPGGDSLRHTSLSESSGSDSPGTAWGAWCMLLCWRACIPDVHGSASRTTGIAASCKQGLSASSRGTAALSSSALVTSLDGMVPADSVGRTASPASISGILAVSVMARPPYEILCRLVGLTGVADD